MRIPGYTFRSVSEKSGHCTDHADQAARDADGGETTRKRRYSERPPRDEYVLTEAGRDFLPVLFMIGAWGRKHRGGGKLVRFLDGETGTEIKPVAIDAVTGAEIGTRPIRMLEPE